MKALECKATQPLLAHRLGGILPANLNYRHPEDGSDPEKYLVPPPSR